MKLKVDELLAGSVLTPRFTCTLIIPNAGRLGIAETPVGDCLFAEGDALYMESILADPNDYLEKTNCAHAELLETTDIKILIEFLKLAEDAQAVNGKHIINKSILFDFVYKHGFPTTQVLQTGDEKDYLLVTNMKRFLDRLNNLYICYALWKAIQIGDYDLIKQVQPHPLTINEMQLELEHRLYSQIGVTVLYFHNKPVLTFQAKDLMALVEAQLAVLASKGDDYLNGGCIEYCADCGQPFIKYRSNSTLCDRCKGNTGKSRRYRAKKKGEKSNG